MPFDRKPLDPGCTSAPAPLVGITDPCAALPLLRAQLYQLMTGGTTQQVRDGDRWQSFHPGNVERLKKEITRLELMCSNAPRAIRAGPPRPLSPYGFRGRY